MSFLATAIGVGEGIRKVSGFMGGLFGKKPDHPDVEKYRTHRERVKAAYNAGRYAEAERIWNTIPTQHGKYTGNDLFSHISRYGTSQAKLGYPAWKAAQSIGSGSSSGKTEPFISGGDTTNQKSMGSQINDFLSTTIGKAVLGFISFIAVVFLIKKFK